MDTGNGGRKTNNMKNDCISVGSLAKLAIAAEQYALTHLDKPLKSYDFLKSVLP